ncbi:MAG: 50S ribosomal protein L30 [Desulfobacterales bacterium]
MAKTLHITLVKSMIGRPEKHRRVLRALGLRRMHQTVEQPDHPAVRGMIHTVRHLVRTEEKGE